MIELEEMHRGLMINKILAENKQQLGRDENLQHYKCFDDVCTLPRHPITRYTINLAQGLHTRLASEPADQ